MPLLKAAYDKGVTTWDTGMHIFEQGDDVTLC